MIQIIHGRGEWFGYILGFFFLLDETYTLTILKKNRKSPIRAVLWGKDKTALTEFALIEFSIENHEIFGKRQKIPFLDNFACF